MLNEFNNMVPELYGEASCTYNMHQLHYVANYASLLGPLWTHSAFCTESKNGQLKHMYHGKGSVLQQLLFNIDITQTLQLLHSSLAQHKNMTVMQYLDLQLYILTYMLTYVSENMHISVDLGIQVMQQTKKELY